MKMEKKKILIVSSVFYPEPVVSARLQTDLAERLSEKYGVTVLRPTPSRPMGFTLPDFDYAKFPFKVVTIDSYTHPASSIIGRFRESISMGKSVARYIERHHADIDFIYNDAWHLFGINIIARKAVKYSIPYITPVQDVYPESLLSKLSGAKLIYRLAYKLLLPIDVYNLRHARKVHTISENMADHLARTRGIDRQDFVVVRNWQDEHEFVEYGNTHTEESQEIAPFTFMYMGNVGKLAGLETVLEAFSRADMKDARLVIAGSGPAKDDLVRQAKNIHDRQIEFWDVPYGAVPATQAKADVMLLPVKKGFALSSIPSKLPAYMFSSKPVLASVDSESDTARCILQGHAGYVCEPEDAEAIAKTMEMIAAAPREDLQAMGKNGFKYAISDFSKTMNLNKLVKAITDAMEA